MKPLVAAVVLVVLAGCAVPVSGLRPVEPPLRPSAYADPPIFPEIDSLQPMLEWEPFDPPEEPQSDWASRLRNIRYDLQVWRLEGNAPAELVYARQGLPEPFHRIETPLAPSTRYAWTVRARFDLDGATRVTAWGSEGRGSRLPQVPNPFYYRFAIP